MSEQKRLARQTSTLREDGIRSLFDSAVSIGLPAERVQELLDEHGHPLALETVRKKMSEAVARQQKT